MSEQSKSDLLLAESISALVDDETSELELARVLKANGFSEVAKTWSSYQIAGAAMRRDLPVDFMPDLSAGFAERVSAAITEEPTYKGMSATKGLSGWWLGLGRMAVAASVAGAIVIGVQLYEQELTVGEPAIADTPRQQDAVDTSLPVGFNAPTLTARTVSAQYGGAPQRQVIFEPRQANVKVSNERIRAYLDSLVGYHTDHAAINSVQGVLPYARMPLVPKNTIKELPNK